jgi:hypothetical protein
MRGGYNRFLKIGKLLVYQVNKNTQGAGTRGCGKVEQADLEGMVWSKAGRCRAALGDRKGLYRMQKWPKRI